MVFQRLQTKIFQLDVAIENLGSTTATNVSATLVTGDSYLTITDNSNPWPNIAAGKSCIPMHISDNVPDQHTSIFDIQMTNGIETWTSNFNFNAPALTPGVSIYPLMMQQAMEMGCSTQVKWGPTLPW